MRQQGISGIKSEAKGSALSINYGTNIDSTDKILLELEQRVEKACTIVEKVIKERKEFKRKEREIRSERALKRKQREARLRELQEASWWPQQQEASGGCCQFQEVRVQSIIYRSFVFFLLLLFQLI